MEKDICLLPTMILSMLGFIILITLECEIDEYKKIGGEECEKCNKIIGNCYKCQVNLIEMSVYCQECKDSYAL